MRFTLPALCLLALASTTFAVTVTTTADSGAGSLRNAIATAVAGDTIQFNLPNPSTITLTSGELLINKNLTITGPGASQLAVSSNFVSQAFQRFPEHADEQGTLLASNDGGNCLFNGGSINTSQGYNLSDDNTCSSAFTATGDENNVVKGAGLASTGLNPRLETLAMGTPAV